MDNDALLAMSYGAPLLALLYGYDRLQRRAQGRHADALAITQEHGLIEAPSLHPVINADRCIGSGGCASACPEHALGVIAGKAVLINPSVCIGHGACAAACPVEAITLVFGSERRGVDIPAVTPKFETDVPGLYIAGELGGMGLIRKAAEQGKQAMHDIAARRLPKAGKVEFDFDVVIIGAGPAGLSAGLGALKSQLRYALIEQEQSLGGAVLHYPRHKVAMTSPVDLPIVGRTRFTDVSKEKLLAFWLDIIEKTGLQVRTGTRMEQLQIVDQGFAVHTNQGVLRARSVLLAIGRRGTPRKLDVPGEILPKVVYTLVNAKQYSDMDVLVVGGGDSAVEAALACSVYAKSVALSYRGAVLNRIKAANRTRLQEAVAANRVRLMLHSEVRAISELSVELMVHGSAEQLANDAVIVCAGGVLPTGMLKALGVRVETRYGQA